MVCTMKIPSCLVGRTQLSRPAPNPSPGSGSPVHVHHILIISHTLELCTGIHVCPLTRQKFPQLEFHKMFVFQKNVQACNIRETPQGSLYMLKAKTCKHTNKQKQSRH